jgi:hypothetical protein
MKQRLIVPIFLLSLGLGRSLMAQASFHYECMSDSAVGYAFDESMRSWKPTEFQKGKSSYSVRHLTDEEIESVVSYKCPSENFSSH